MTGGITGEPARVISRWRRWAALAVLSLSLAGISMDMTILNVALPQLAADVHATSVQQLWIVDIYSLVLAGLLVPMSAAADRLGRRSVLLTGYGIFAAASLLVVLADSAPAVIAIRALLGIGGAMIMPTTLSMIRVVFTDPRERTTALGIWAAASSVGMAIGPVLGGFLLEHGSWHAAFLVNIPVMGVALVAGSLLLPEFRSPTPPQWDLPGALASITGTVALIWAITTFAERGVTDQPAWIALLAGTGILAWFIRRCLRHDNPMLDLGLFRSKPFTAGILAATTFMFAMSALLLLSAQWLQIVEGASPLEAGLAMLPAVLAVGVASPLAPGLAARIGARAVLGGGLGVTGMGFLTIYLAPQPISYGWMVVAMILLGAGAGSLAVGSALIISGTPQTKAGHAAALEETSYELGSVLGIAVLGSAAAAIYSSRITSLASQAGLDLAQVRSAGQSLSAAEDIARAAGTPELMTLADRAFTTALADTGLIGFVVMTLAAVGVTVLVPRRYDITRAVH